MKEAVSRGQFFLHEMAATYTRKGMDGQKLVALAFASWLLNTNRLQGWSRSLPSVRFPLVFASLSRSGSIDLPLIE
eukprot:14420029-Alexandrium_andersonii.AAC.1